MIRTNTYANTHFDSLRTAPFDPKMYSRMKFGSDLDAKYMGESLARGFFVNYSQVLRNRCVVFASPYNYVKNAATAMTEHFIAQLNRLCVRDGFPPVEYSLIHRKVSYTNDYGRLSADERKRMLDGDSFYLNERFIEGKTLLFIDDIRITGAHEKKLIEVLRRENVENEKWFLYYSSFIGTSCPSVEAELNFSAIKSLDDIVKLSELPNHHVLIRPIKFLLMCDPKDLQEALPKFGTRFLEQIFDGAIAEHYHEKPEFKVNLQMIARSINQFSTVN